MADRHRDDWRESSRDSYWRDRDRDRAPPRRVFDPQTGESHPLPYESKDRYIITHKASKPPTFRVYGITEYLEKWELHASRSQWSEEEIIENFLFNVDPSLGKEVKEARPKDGKWTTYKKNLVELYKFEDNKYSIKDLETMTQDEDESIRAFGMRFQKISDVLMKKGKISEVERCTIFIGHLSKGRQKSILRDLPCDKLDFPEVLKLAIKVEADDFKDLVWRGMRRRDFSLYKEYVTDRCPDFKDHPWSEKNEAVVEEVKEIRDMVRGLTRQVTEIVTSIRATTYRDKPGGPYSLRWDHRNTDESWRRRDDEIDQDRRARETYGRARRLDDYSRNPRYEADRGRGDSQGRWESDQGRRDGYRDNRYQRSDRDGYREGRYKRTDRDGYRGGGYERGERDGDRRDNSHGRAARGSTSRGTDDRPPTLRNSCVYCRGDDHIKRDCPDLKRAINEGLVVLDDRKYVKWADDLGDVSMFPSMKENIEARRVRPSKGKEPVRSQSIKITFEGDKATTPIRVAATKSARGSTSKKTDTDYVMAEKEGQRIDGEEVILSPRKQGVKKFLMKSSLDEIDTVEPLRRALRQPMQCSILEYLATSKPTRDELQMITRKTRIPLSEEVQMTPKAEAPTVAVTGVTARADRMATVLLDGMEGVPPDKFYILGSGAVEAIINDGAVLDAVIDNGGETVIIDEDLAVQVGLGLDRSYLFEIETADGRKQQIIGVCHKAALEVQGLRVTLPVFAVKNCSSDLLLGRTWLSHVHAVTIERPDGSQTLSIKKLDEARVMIETVEPRDPRNTAALAVGARPSDQIKSLPISGHTVQFREKKYEPLLTEEEGRIVKVEDLGSRMVVDRNSYPKETDEEFGGADLQKVNAVTIRDVGSVPHADLLAEGAAGRSIYSVCDLFSGYDEVPLDPRDRHLMAMHTPLGLIQMMVVPMGWTNGVVVFQRAMVAVLKDFIPDKVEVFLDDFPIKGPVNKDETEVVPGVRRFVEKPLTDICAVLEQLDDANLTASGTKSQWVVSTIKILGFIYDSRGRRADPAKLDKLLNWSSPLHSPTEVRQFLGVIGYCRIFIRGYAEKAEPLRLLLRKTEKFYWDSSQGLAMQELKDEFKEGGRILGVPFFDDEAGRPFIVSTDAGPCSVGGLLSQKDAGGKERPLRFESRTLNTAERNRSIQEGSVSCSAVSRHVQTLYLWVTVHLESRSHRGCLCPPEGL
ncbi:hypothetical protein CBR_g17114 [Chara braunii]|uniref:Reverse transcriptase domain-containing protein n=1 Tax=Chara braunii TaxID=69332 RepID=A0A388KUN5_CHABU|nr:hypothetical protein CBR_g17114 [Chara braunii]|eukprot:GBG73775.1 hypothetical protein CBR_g17114 [Chara braunii]